LNQGRERLQRVDLRQSQARSSCPTAAIEAIVAAKPSHPMVWHPFAGAQPILHFIFLFCVS
jgi:hypothetical protein